MAIKPTGRNIKILVADDERGLCEVIRFALKLNGYTVITAGNGAEALAAFKNNSDIDVVLTDVNMPVMNGIELVHEILYLEPLARCILMTARPDQWEVAEFRLTGLLAGFLEKPFTVETLQQVIEEILDTAESRCAIA